MPKVNRFAVERDGDRIVVVEAARVEAVDDEWVFLTDAGQTVIRLSVHEVRSIKQAPSEPDSR